MKDIPVIQTESTYPDDEEINEASPPLSPLEDREKWEVEQEEKARQISEEDFKPHENKVSSKL